MSNGTGDSSLVGLGTTVYERQNLQLENEELQLPRLSYEEYNPSLKQSSTNRGTEPTEQAQTSHSLLRPTRRHGPEELTVIHTIQSSDLGLGASVELQDLSKRSQIRENEFNGEWFTSASPSSEGGGISALFRKMTTALLRASPAAGASSYGALPTIPQSEYASSLEDIIDSDTEAVGYGQGVSVGHGQHSDFDGQDEEFGVESNMAQKLRSRLVGAEGLGPGRPDKPVGGGRGEGLGEEGASTLNREELDEDAYDEDDPPDNSP